MSKRHRLFISLVLCFEDGHEPVFLPITPPFHIVRFLPLWRLGGCTRVLHMFHPRIVPETEIQHLDPFKTPTEPHLHRATADNED